LIDQALQIDAVDQLHGQVDDPRLLSGIVGFDHVGMIEIANSLHFTLERAGLYNLFPAGRDFVSLSRYIQITVTPTLLHRT
jgi:hypothetical protein